MQNAFRTARLRRVAVLAALGLASAGGTIGVCVALHSRAETARHSQLALLHLEGDVRRMQTLPQTTQGKSSLAAVLTELNDLGVQTQQEFARLANTEEADELRGASGIDRKQMPFLLAEATLFAQRHIVQADQLAAVREHSIGKESRLLAQAEADFGVRANRAETIADDSAIAAILLALITCGLLFLRLVLSNKAAKSANAFAESILESSPDGIFAYDMGGRYAIWNRASEELTGLSRADMIGRLPLETPAGLINGARAAREAALNGDRAELRNVVVNVPRAQGHSMDVVYAPLHDGDGRVVGGVGHVRDVTERNALEQAVRQSQKLEAIGQLAGGIAHDFNNLLMGIGGYATLAQHHAPKDNTVLRHDLVEIERAVSRARVLTEQLLFFARRREQRSTAVDLNELVREATELLHRVIESSVSIELDLHEPAWVIADPAQLEQVLLNLGANARDAMPDGGVLTIRTRVAETGQVQLEIQDTGTGISDEIQSHVFEPFFTTKEVGHGTGLGLASAYGIVTQNGGSIELDSALGRGTTFTITLPPAAPAAVEPISVAPAIAQDGTGTILFVEDDPVVRELVASGLENEGYKVVVKPSPSEALAYAGVGGTFDLLVTDVVMPGLGGAELAARLRRGADRPFNTIYVSGYPASGVELDEHSVFLQKPFDLAELYTLVGRLLLEAGDPGVESRGGAARVSG